MGSPLAIYTKAPPGKTAVLLGKEKDKGRNQENAFKVCLNSAFL